MTLTWVGSGALPGAAAWVLLVLVLASMHVGTWALLAALFVRGAGRRAATVHALWRLALLGPLLSVALTLAWRAHALPALHAAVARPASGAQAWSLAVDAAGPVAQLAAMLVLAGFVVGGARLAGSVHALRRAIAGRTPVRDPRLLQRFAALRARAAMPRAVLTESAFLTGPLVVGRREVCVPAGGLRAFPDAELDAVLAHELAHLARGDGVWFPIFAAVEMLLPMQPLFGWVARRCRQSAELAADERAVALTGAPRALACAITRIAAQQLAHRAAGLVPAMGASARVIRVKRLIEADAQASGSRSRVGWPLLGVGVFAVLPLLPGVHANTASDDPAYLQQREVLARRGRALEVALAGAQLQSTPEPLRVDELAQELRHLRATEAWLEARTRNAAP